jgi:hypothetical protein
MDVEKAEKSAKYEEILKLNLTNPQKSYQFKGISKLKISRKPQQNINKVIVDTGVWIKHPNQAIIKIIISDKRFTIDHLTTDGMAVYGPIELYKFLDKNKIQYAPIQEKFPLYEENVRQYPSSLEIEQNLKNIHQTYPNITSLESIGTSIKGKNLWFIKISDYPWRDEVEPEFKYIANMHGDEITGRELMMELILELCQNYSSDPDIRELIDNTEIFIMPSMNPDGADLQIRGNANYVDLNRSFPDFTTADNLNIPDGREPEIQAVMIFQNKRNFSFSANFHGGAEVVNYPWDTMGTRHPFDAMLQDISLAYSSLVPYIFNSLWFTNGITNGWDWYEVDGGMQDWSEYYLDDLQITIELSDEKWPPYSEMDWYYLENKDALLQYIKIIHQGAGFYFIPTRQYSQDSAVSGIVNLHKWDGAEFVSIHQYNFINSEFYRVLEPGVYQFVVLPNGKPPTVFKKKVVSNTVIPNGNYERLQ